MTKTEFQHYIDKYAGVISQIKESAHALHASVNQTYDGDRPYGFHLDMVAIPFTNMDMQFVLANMTFFSCFLEPITMTV